ESALMRSLVETTVEEGRTVELVADAGALCIEVDGRRVAATSDRRAESHLAELALSPWAGRDDLSVLLGGLGMGFTLRALLDAPGVSRVDVVETSPAVIAWNREVLGEHNR